MDQQKSDFFDKVNDSFNRSNMESLMDMESLMEKVTLNISFKTIYDTHSLRGDECFLKFTMPFLMRIVTYIDRMLWLMHKGVLSYVTPKLTSKKKRNKVVKLIGENSEDCYLSQIRYVCIKGLCSWQIKYVLEPCLKCIKHSDKNVMLEGYKHLLKFLLDSGIRIINGFKEFLYLYKKYNHKALLKHFKSKYAEIELHSHRLNNIPTKIPKIRKQDLNSIPRFKETEECHE